MPKSIIYNDTHIAGEFSCKSFTPPAGSITNNAVDANAAIDATKVVQQYNKTLQRAVPSGDETASVHLAYGDGEIIDFQVFCGTAPASGKSYKVDLQINGVTALSSVITITDATTPLTPAAGTISVADYDAGDILSVVIDDVAGGTLGTDLFCQLIVNESPEPA